MNKVAKKKLNVLAKEFEVAPAEVIALIKEKTGVEKKTTNVLTEADRLLQRKTAAEIREAGRKTGREEGKSSFQAESKRG